MINTTALEKIIGTKIKDQDLYTQAFTHRSFINEHPHLGLSHNERLEFLGDAVLELVATHALFLQYPKHPEGQLTAFRSAIVRTESISESAREIGLNDFLLLSKGESRDTGKARDYILANTYEALIGAIYLDAGYEAASAFIKNTLLHKVEGVVEGGLWRDPKSYTQEKAQEQFNVTPMYKSLKDEGPDHDKIFTVGVFFGEKEVARGVGKSKQDAEQAAARKAIEMFNW
ncbi:MAG TPA: ribonuclease III [Candidatus Paceibacterota bacterium]